MHAQLESFLKLGSPRASVKKTVLEKRSLAILFVGPSTSAVFTLRGVFFLLFDGYL